MTKPTSITSHTPVGNSPMPEAQSPRQQESRRASNRSADPSLNGLSRRASSGAPGSPTGGRLKIARLQQFDQNKLKGENRKEGSGGSRGLPHASGELDKMNEIAEKQMAGMFKAMEIQNKINHANTQAKLGTMGAKAAKDIVG